MNIADCNTSINQEIFFELTDVPIYCNVLWPSSELAKNCPKGDIRLALDKCTGLISNVAFDPGKLDYDQDYDNSLHFSPKFQEYAQTLACQLIDSFNLFNKDIIEIGCGKGDFLFSLCTLENNRGVGFDPTYIPRAEHQKIGDRLIFIQDYYSEEYKNHKADLIVCRHTLEHVPNPADLLEPLRRATLDCDTAIFFEVPNGLDTFHRLAIWDIIYEHCCYYTPHAISQIFNDHGFEVQNVYETYAGQFLCIEALPVTKNCSSIEEQTGYIENLESDLRQFTKHFQHKVENWGNNLSNISSEGRAVIWGAGSKGVTFLNLLKEHQAIEFAVDLNPLKQGKYVPGTGQQVVSPDFLKQYQPDTVLVMNPIYKEEIAHMLTELGCKSELRCV